MPVGLLGRKIGMTQIYDDDGEIQPSTVIQAGPCVVLQLRTLERDGYQAVQLGFGEKPRRSASRSERGHMARIGSKRQKRQETAGVELLPKPDCEPALFVREFRLDGEQVEFEVGQTLTADIFAPGESSLVYVDVIGTSKGRGTAGVMKRHNFHGQRASHGVKRVHRHAGSIGMSADPARVFKGTRMTGRYGNAQITVRHLQVLKADEEHSMLVVKGAVPGPNGGFLVIRPTNKR